MNYYELFARDVPKEWNGGHIGFPNESYGTLALFLFKSFLLF